ncbi:MAG: amidohydrolase [Bradymonadales bacterium]|nr:amidohydrolase [Bradymonadales bacterium]
MTTQSPPNPACPPIAITNASVITLDERGTVLTGTDIAIANGKIVALGILPDDFTPHTVIDGSNRVAMPAFFNAHTHAAMTLVRGWADDLPLDRWFNERIWVAESNLTAEDVYWGASLAAAEMIRSGTVGFADHYFYMDQVARVVEQAGLKASLAWCVFGIGADKEIGTDLTGSLQFIRHWHGAADGRIKTVLGPHSPYVCPPEFLEQVAKYAGEFSTGIHLHLSESEEQVANSLDRFGLSPTALLAQIGIFDHSTIAAHCIHLAEGDLEILAERGVHVVQCPNCHFKLGMGVTDVPAMLRLGINVCLGTDGTASNNDLDMLEEARLASFMQKNHRRDPEVLGNDTVLRLATANGARALGFPDSGTIAVGRPADLILFDFDKPHLRPRHNLVSNIIYSAKSPDITHVIADGRLLLDDGALTTLDEERILYEAEQRAWRMVGSEMKMVRQYRG